MRRHALGRDVEIRDSAATASRLRRSSVAAALSAPVQGAHGAVGRQRHQLAKRRGRLVQFGPHDERGARNPRRLNHFAGFALRHAPRFSRMPRTSARPRAPSRVVSRAPSGERSTRSRSHANPHVRPRNACRGGANATDKFRSLSPRSRRQRETHSRRASRQTRSRPAQTSRQQPTATHRRLLLRLATGT